MRAARRAVLLGVASGVAVVCGLPSVATAAPVADAASTSGSGTTWLFLIGIPLLVVIAVVLISAAPSWTQSGRYNPAAGWFAEPVWLGSGPESEASLDSVASASAADVSADPGGVSASW